MRSDGFEVLILGGGNCGLALATGLQKAGIKYVLFERDSEEDFYHRPRDWGMLLHWGVDYLAKLLPEQRRDRLMHDIRCDAALDRAQYSTPVPYINCLTGEVMAEVPMSGVDRVSRMKLRRFLMPGGGELNVEFGKAVRSVEVGDDHDDDAHDTVRVTFQDGSVRTGSMAIGCDGSHSIVREFLVGPDAAQLEPVDLTMINFPFAGYTADEARLLQTGHPVLKIAAHPDKPGNGILAALDISNRQDPTTWKFQNYLGWWGPPYARELQQDPDAAVAHYRAWATEMCEPFRTAFLKPLEQGGEGGSMKKLPVYAGQQWAPTMPWDNRRGRVTLAGDAAHSMLPQRGQGLNHALKDASDIVDAIAAAVIEDRCTLADSITAYETEMKPRGAKEVALSLEQATRARDMKTLRESPIFRQGWKRGEDA